MPAAFRCARQVSEISGGVFEMTIHPEIQDLLIEADKKGEIKREKRIDAPVDDAAVKRVAGAFPEFLRAYEPEGLSIDEFDAYGGVTMTLNGFGKGWQQLLLL
jgi:transaldolase